APDSLAAYEFSFDSPFTATDADLEALVVPSFQPGRPILEAALDLTARIYREFAYDPTATTLATPVAEVVRMRRGVCQDFAHLQLACLRRIGLPARYVSGYLLTYPPPGGQKLIGADASHAWLSIWCPGSGWVDLDPTNNKIPRDEHITLAWGRDYGDVSPIRGVIVGGAAQSMEVAVDVNPVDSIDALPPRRLAGTPIR
ncbi:MAG: transglutaminase family protein, partial [Alphaproteobacteria bacterium]